MTEETVKQIVCAVRGRPESRKTITYAIDLALEHKASLTFLHILDAEFLGHATIGPLSVVYDELVAMGEFAMMILVDRANRRGVQQTDYKILAGNIRRQLKQFALDTQADTLVVGLPGMLAKKPIFKVEEFEKFVEELQQTANIDVHVVGHD